MNWRTSTVVQLCEAMRQTQEFDALPILADALQDADYPDMAILAAMRFKPDAIGAQKLVAMVYSDETAAAVQWFADSAPMFDQDYRGLIEVARGAAEHGDFVTEYDSETWRSNYYDVEDRFWEAYQLITAKKVEERNNPFNCSC
jgi:hypothetical protein